jgi:hypothetical protein
MKAVGVTADIPAKETELVTEMIIKLRVQLQPAYLPITDAATGACPVASSAGTAHIPQMVNNEAVILYFRIVSANGPVKEGKYA